MILCERLFGTEVPGSRFSAADAAKSVHIFRTMGYNLTNPWPGIYYVNKEGFFPLQIIASGEMRQEAHVWLSSLRSEKR